MRFKGHQAIIFAPDAPDWDSLESRPIWLVLFVGRQLVELAELVGLIYERPKNHLQHRILMIWASQTSSSHTSGRCCGPHSRARAHAELMIGHFSWATRVGLII